MSVPFTELAIIIGALMTSVRSAAFISGDKPESTTNIASIEGCDDGMVINCRTLPIFNYTNLPPPPVPGDDGDIILDQNCPYKSLERHNRCVDVFTRRCLTDEQRRSFYRLYSVPTLEMQELCTDNGPLREDYWKHATCLRRAHAEYVKCSHQYQTELSTLITDNGPQQQQQQQQNDGIRSNPITPVTGAEHITQNLARLCRAFRGHLTCVHGIVRTTCGQQTEEFASKFLSQMSFPLLNLCNSYGNSVKSEESSSSDAIGTLNYRLSLGALAVRVILTMMTAFSGGWW